jgi:Ca2+-binding RTX toxin-like protein
LLAAELSAFDEAPWIGGADDQDLASGTGGTDLLLGQNAADAVGGLGGNDLLCGGRGPDTLGGGSGADRFGGGPGPDTANDLNPSEEDSQDGSIP